MNEVCPKCGYDQIENDECLRCRVIVSKYQSYLASLGTRPTVVTREPTDMAGVVEGRVEWAEGSPAGFWVRGAALFVDGLAFAAALFPFLFLVVLPTMVAGRIGRPDPALFLAVNMGYNLVALVVYTGYFIWMHGRWGQTLGKIATGVRVVRIDGEPIGYGRACIRVLIPQLGTLLQLGSVMMSASFQAASTVLVVIVLLVDYLMAAFRRDKRALHDLLAGTRVIKVRRAWLEGRPAGFWMRLAALLLDWEIVVVPVVFFGGILMAVAIPTMVMRRQRDPTIMGAVVLALILTYLALLIAYSIWMHGRWGQTLGKMAIGVRVVTVQGEKIGYGTACLRWISSVFSAIILLVGYLIAGFRSDKRSLHDLIAGTRVVWVR